ncbi:multiple inositol polyphosphate phosphatase 1-like [Periplaneta americana]|uniref:multiple inositol polyphosphate phosphatase 1-like n=1 Tax=Periplaneta americana TaxID=6978 RepID=UPI0037E73D46
MENHMLPWKKKLTERRKVWLCQQYHAPSNISQKRIFYVALMRLCLLWVVLVAPFVVCEGENYCYANLSNPYTMFSTYTPYEYVREKQVHPVKIPQCKPLQLWLLSRHGTRYPDEGTISRMWTLPELLDQIASNHYILKMGNLCVQDLENLRKWTPQAVSTVAMSLTSQGYKDMYKMAQRFKIRFPSLLNKSYHPDLFEVQFTNTQRTTLSAYAFIDGIFGTTINVKLPRPNPGDKLLKPHSRCNAWIQEVDKNEDTLREKMAFDSSEHMRSLIQAVSTRLGFKHELSHSYVDSMYITCRFEKAWRVKELSPWCAVFSEEELKILEFRDDLKYYYFLGYANEINKKVGCPPAKDFLYRFSQLEMGDAQPAGVFYFSHDTVLQLFFTSIDIGKDEVPLTHSNFEEMRDRQWRTSILTPFAGNFAAVFFKCNGNESHKVQFYLREKLLDMDGCDEGLCDWSYIKQKYNSIIKKCNLDFCELKR